MKKTIKVPDVDSGDLHLIDSTSFRQWKRLFRRAIRKAKTPQQLHYTLIACLSISMKKSDLERSNEIIKSVTKS